MTTLRVPSAAVLMAAGALGRARDDLAERIRAAHRALFDAVSPPAMAAN